MNNDDERDTAEEQYNERLMQEEYGELLQIFPPVEGNSDFLEAIAAIGIPVIFIGDEDEQLAL